MLAKMSSAFKVVVHTFALSLWFAAGSAMAATSDNGLSDDARFWQIVRQDFAAWDYNHDGQIDVDEVDAAVQLPSIKGANAAALSAIKVFLRGEAKKDGGIESFNLEALCPTDESGKETKVGKSLVGLFSGYCKKIAKESPLLFADGKPHIESIHQGRTGDC